MATLRDILRKISAVKKTQQITKAMNMVAASKLRSIQMRMENYRPYASKFQEVMDNLSPQIDPESFPLMAVREVKNIELILVTSDRGLCGSFNVNLINNAQRFVREKTAAGNQVGLFCVGRKGRDYYRRRKAEIREAQVDCYNTFNLSMATQVGRSAMSNFLAGESDEVYVLFSHFVNMAVQRPKLQKLLPIVPSKPDEEKGPVLEYLYEPSAEAIFQNLLPQSVIVQLYSAIIENMTSEQAARMTAMDNASRNCKEMILSLTLIYNKARQAAITKELMDIVGGAEALKK
jgi:F-type H+-transporting ATPase subunit gamma